MINKKYFWLLLLISILLLPLVSARSFSITNYDIAYTLQQNGIVAVSEKLDYSLSGCFHELFLQRPNVIISNPSGYCVGTDCAFEYKQTGTVSGDPELILKGDYCDTQVTTYFNYNIEQQIRTLEDGAQFYYQVYPGNTGVSTNANITIIFPGDINQTTRFIHSKDYSSQINDNVLIISKPVGTYEIIEVNILMPKEWFDSNSLYHYFDANYTQSQIIQLEQNWQEGYDRYNKEESIANSKTNYVINNYDINYTLNRSGTISVSEKIDYSVNVCLTELSIQRFDVINPAGYCIGGACTFEYKTKNTLSGYPELILDGNFCDTNVTAYFNYNKEKAMIGLTDGTLLKQWMYDDRVGISAVVRIYIFFPGDTNQVTMFLSHPDFYKHIEGNYLLYQGFVNAYDGIYLTAVMPKDWFDQNNLYSSNSTVAQVIKDEEQRLKNIEEQEYLKNSVIDPAYYMSPVQKQTTKTNWILNYLILFVSLFSILFIVWLIFGKEYSPKKVNYFGMYERDLPGDEDPLKANYLITGTFSKDWFSSAIMYLVWKKQYDLEKREDKYFLIRNKSTKLENLPSYIEKIDKFLNKHYSEGTIDLDQLKNRLKSQSIFSEDYRNNYEKIIQQGYDFTVLYQKIYTEYENWFKKSKLFNDTGFIIATAIFSISLFVTFFLSAWAFMITIFVYIFGATILSLIPYFFKFKLVFGRFSKVGRVKNLQWTNFEKYITDFSLMKKYPPKHVILWEEYMVYATAFGVAKQTSKVLKIVLPQEINSNNNLTTYAGFSVISSGFSGVGGFSGSGGTGGSSFGGGGGGGGGGFGGGGGGGGGAGAR